MATADRGWAANTRAAAAAGKSVDEDLFRLCMAVCDNFVEGEPRPQHLGLIEGLRIIVVDGNKVKTTHSMDFHEAGNGYGWEHGFIPKNEIWIDDTVRPRWYPFNLYHEIHEVRLMRRGMKYDPAHELANPAERVFRLRE